MKAFVSFTGFPFRSQLFDLKQPPSKQQQKVKYKIQLWELQKQKRLNLKHFFVVSTVKVFAIVLQLMSDPCDVTQSDVSAESLKHSRNTSLKKKIKFTVKNVTFDFHFQTSEVKRINNKQAS